MIQMISREVSGDMRLIDLTVDELKGVIAQMLGIARERQQAEIEQLQRGWYEYGIGGIARAFGVSRTTAQRIKSSGVIDGAISQSGRSIVIDVKRALELTAGSRWATVIHPAKDPAEVAADKNQTEHTTHA